VILQRSRLILLRFASRAAARRALAVLLGRLLVRPVLRRYRPAIVTISGSVGKTTTSRLTAAILAERFRVLSTRGNENSPMSLVAVLVGYRRTGRLARDVVGMCRAALATLRRGHYAELLVLEVAAGRPGGLRAAMRIIRPDVAVITNVRDAHLEYFGTIEAIAAEKSRPVRRLKPGGVAVLNVDDPRVRAMSSLTRNRTVGYGLSPAASVRATDLRRSETGITATVEIRRADGQVESASLATPLLAHHQAYSLLAALAAADALGVPLERAVPVATRFQPPEGRLSRVRGPAGMTILDDSHNASPQAMLDSLEALRTLPAPHQAVLGEMRQLGPHHERAHRMVGAAVAGWLDALVTVGPGGARIAAAAAEHGMDPARIRAAESPEAAAELVRRDGGGTVLVKGSSALQLERAVELLRDDAPDGR